MMKGMVVVTNLRREVDFATLYYIVEHDIVEVGKKKSYRHIWALQPQSYMLINQGLFNP